MFLRRGRIRLRACVKPLSLVPVCVALLLAVNSADASPGALDSSFGSGGIVTTTIASGGSIAHALAVQSNGRIVAGGETLVGSEDEFALARYNTDGSLDNTFGSGGKVTTAIGSGSQIASLAIQSNGEIVAAGTSQDESSVNSFALARYTASGSLDTSFGTGGEVVTPISGGGTGSSMALQSDGKIVVAGASGSPCAEFVIVRYDANGALDTSFGTGGEIDDPIAGCAAASGVVVQTDGKIVVAGGCCGGSPAIVLARYNADGSPDTSFGTDGVARSNAYSETPYGLAIQPDGKLVVAGTMNNDFALLRFNGDGSLDTSFAGDGWVMDTIGSASSAQAVSVAPNGDIDAAGYGFGNGGSTSDFVAAQYAPDGSTAATFGVVTTAIGSDPSSANAVGIETGGDIVAAGNSYAGSNRFTLARYQVASSPSTFNLKVSVSGDGTVTSSPAGIDCGATCSHAFPQDATVTLTATPAAGSTFGGWSGNCTSGGSATCQLAMNGDETAQATFVAAPVFCHVPKLVGKYLRSAKNVLTKAHCSLGHVLKKFSRKRKGVIVAQSPRPGQTWPLGGAVKVTISKGKRR